MTDGGPNGALLAQEALLDACADYSGLDDFLKTRLNLNLAWIAPASGALMPAIALAVFREFEKRSHVADLARALYGRFPAITKVQRFYLAVVPGAQLLPTAPVPWTQHVPCCVGAGTVVIDREELQQAIHDAETRLGRRVVVVTGNRRTGKTFTRDVISALAPRYRYNVVSVDLSGDNMPPDGGADILIRKAAIQLRIPTAGLPERGGATGERWAKELAEWLVGSLRPLSQAPPTALWIIFDGFDQRHLPQEVTTMLDHLGVMAATDLPHVRICLLGYHAPLSYELSRRVRAERLRPIGSRELTRFFEQAFKRHQVDVGEDVIQETVGRVLECHAAVQVDADASLGVLHDLVSDAIQLLFCDPAGDP